MVIGVSDFIDCVKAELIKSGFKSISIISTSEGKPDMSFTDMVAEYVGAGCSCIEEEVKIPVIYPFDFVIGAGAIVIMPGDDNELQHKDNLRLWAAEYMVGYCAFWNVEGCEWLQFAPPEIREAKTSEAAQRTAAYICTKIAANIAVRRNVKHFPRLYLSKNLE